MNIQELKTNIWSKTEPRRSTVTYDETLDTTIIYLTEKETERIITHFVDDNVALLYRYSDKEVVGIRIEYFKEEFIPKIAETGWKLSDTGAILDGDIDLSFSATEIQKPVTRPLTSTIEQLTIPKFNKKLRFERVHL